MNNVTRDDATGLRNVCDMHLRGVSAIGGDPSQHLEPGDIIVGRTDAGWISRLITSLDGYWSHSMIYIGSGWVAEAGMAGVSAAPLTAIEKRYPDGIAFARPQLDPRVRNRAAEWAANVADGRELGETQYSGRDIGMAFALLVRARGRGAIEALPAQTDDDDFESLFSFDGYSSTCSGFVCTAYRDGGGVELEIEPAPGIRVNDGRLGFPEEISLLDSLVADVDSDHESLLPSRTDLARWRATAKLLAGAAVGIASMIPLDRTVALEDGVTPADLWCSPSIGGRWFFTADHARRALEACAHCD